MTIYQSGATCLVADCLAPSKSSIVCWSSTKLHIIIILSKCSIRLYLQLFVRELMSDLRYVCWFPYSGVQSILCSGFILSMTCVVCAYYCHFLWIVHS